MNDLREILKDNIPKNGNFMLEDAIIEKSDENELTIKDIEKNNQVFYSDKKITKIDINFDETIGTLIKQLNGKISNDCKIKYEDTELTFEESKNKEISIKDLSSENSIYYISGQNN